MLSTDIHVYCTDLCIHMTVYLYIYTYTNTLNYMHNTPYTYIHTCTIHVLYMYYTCTYMYRNSLFFPSGKFSSKKYSR